MRHAFRFIRLAIVLVGSLSLWGQNERVALDGSVRLRVESWNWFDTGAADPDYEFLGSLLRLGVSKASTHVDWRVEAAQPALVGLPDDAVAPAPQGQLGLGATYRAVNGHRNDAGLFIKQAELRFHDLGGLRNWLRAGRFELIDGVESMPKDPSLAAVKRTRIAHRLIGNFGFTHVGRSFDGIQYFQDQGAFNGTIAAVRPTEGVFSLDGWGELDVDLLYGAITGSGHGYDARIFAIGYRDRRGLRKNDNSPTSVGGDVEIRTVGAHILRELDLGGVRGDLLLWGAFQGGDWGAIDHEATAVAAEVGIRPGGGRKPAMRFGWCRGSGDRDGGDGRHETFVPILPTPRIYARFPFYNMMNTDDRFIEAAVKARENVTIVIGWHKVRLVDGADLWYAGGGAFDDEAFGFPGRPSRGRTELATIVDLTLDWSVSRTLAASLYAGFANGGDVVRTIYPDGSGSRYVFLELTRKFSARF